MQPTTFETRPEHPVADARATCRTVTVLGVLATFTGVEHGLGEIVQGPVAPPAVVFESWPDVAAFEPLDGEPAMSLIPNLLVSGIVSVLVALALGAVAVRFADHRHLGPALLGLSVLLLLVGGGFGPPLVGIVAGLLAGRIGRRPAHAPGPATRFGARLWPWPLAVAVGCFLGLVPGTGLVQVAFGWSSPTLVGIVTLGAFAATAVTIWSARAHDHLTKEIP